jgi:hypothetical protein
MSPLLCKITYSQNCDVDIFGDHCFGKQFGNFSGKQFNNVYQKFKFGSAIPLLGIYPMGKFS